LRRKLLLLLLSVLCIVGFVHLGIWQLHRAEYKQDLLVHSHQVLVDRNVQPLAASVDAAMPDKDHEADAYEWTSGPGHFLPLPALRLDNQVRGGLPGIRVYRIFQPDGGHHALLVELGWRSLPSRLQFPPEPAPPAVTQVRGLMSPPPVAGISLGHGVIQHQPDGPLLLIKLDPDRVATELHLANGLAPRVLRLDPGMKFGYKRDLAMLSGTLTAEQHRAYAVQWFAMALALLITTLVVAWPRPRKKPEA
jgi:surfeit locus 1 family protein